ncbi:hypothetical protein B9Z55_017724 [Caenorhabditis nigoni]|uniref:Cytochrome P450 n=1 Tax=Caenorhabditis nigoni TaxID=1611254 RepID=A0A2G5TAZ1_9PELO|nr:hypothetical protein B9Z55_017724 [Caenorhabditis nigoni]
MSVFIFAFFAFVTAYIAHFYWKVSKYPKGPLPLPFFGNLLQNFVTSGDAFINRGLRPPETLFHPDVNVGIGMSNGDIWRVQRRTSLKILRDFGLGRNLMEEQVTRSVNEMLQQLETIKDKMDVDMYWPIQLCVGNVINENLFGYHYSYKDMEKFQKFVMILNKHMKNLTGRPQLLIAAWPWLRHVPILGEMGYHSIKRNIQHYHKFIEDEVACQIEKYDENSEPENFVHAYLKQINQSGNPELKLVINYT